MSKKRKQDDAQTIEHSGPPSKELRAQTRRREISSGDKEYLSDGMSFDADSDGDLPVVCLESPRKNENKHFAKHDVVWVPYIEKNRPEVFWPAVISSVSKRHINYYWVNEERAFSSYRCPIHKVISFDDEAKNLELRDLGIRYYYTQFKSAYDRVTQYFASSASDAIRYLTYCGQKDGIKGAKDHLFRLGVPDTDDKVSDDKSCSIGGGGEGEDEEEVEEETANETEQRALEDWEAHIETPSEKLTHDEWLKIRNEAECLLPIIDSEECTLYLKKVMTKEEISERHLQFGDPELQLRTGLGPFSMFGDLTNQYLDRMEEHCENLRKESMKITTTYARHVLHPEAIIYAMMRYLSCDKIKADMHFLSTCKKLGKQPTI